MHREGVAATAAAAAAANETGSGVGVRVPGPGGASRADGATRFRLLGRVGTYPTYRVEQTENIYFDAETQRPTAVTTTRLVLDHEA